MNSWSEEDEEFLSLLEWEETQRRKQSTDWQDWLQNEFPAVCTAPHGERHIDLWEWFESLSPGVHVPAQVKVWPRGGAKSTVGELGVVRTCVKKSRKFWIYVSEAQDQANKHVQSIADWMEQIGIPRAVNMYGQSKGWKANILRAEDFNVLALGLDTASRGVKLGQFRPDGAIFDDIDNHTDTLDTVDKKITTITTGIIPAGAPDLAILFLQNKIHRNGIVSRLCDNRAGFLLNRAPAFVEPAVTGLRYESVVNEGKPNTWRITGGSATWEGQNLETCEKQLNDWGDRAFLREAQHEVEDADGIFFRVSNIEVIKPAELPDISRVCLAWDLAATEAGGDHTVGILLGQGSDGRYYILAIIRGQWSSERVRQVIALACETFLPQYARRTVRFPQDPGQAGKDQVKQLQETFKRWSVRTQPVTGSKSDRATNAAEGVNLGNVSIVERDLPDVFAPFVESLSFWHFWPRFQEVLRNFKEDVTNQADDDVDAFADSWNELAGKRLGRTV